MLLERLEDDDDDKDDLLTNQKRDKMRFLHWS